MALRTAEPDAPEGKREDRIAEQQAARFEPGASDEFARYGSSREESLNELQKFLADSEDGAGGYRNSAEDGTVKDQEEQGGGASYKDNFTGGQQASPKRSIDQRIKGAITGNKKKSAAATIAGLITAGFIGGSFLFGGFLGPIAFFANITLDQFDPLSALEERGTKLKREKIRPGNATTFGCSRFESVPSVKCGFVTMSEKMAKRYNDAGIEITGKQKFGKRIKPTEFKFKGQTYSAEEFLREASRPNSELGFAAAEAQKMKFLGLSGPAFVKKALARFGLSKRAPTLEGSVDERTKALTTRTGSGSISGDLEFVEAYDEDGNRIYEDGEPQFRLKGDSDGDTYSQADIDNVPATMERVKTIKKPLTHGALRAVNVLGWYDTGCTLIKAVGKASIGVKVANAAQLAEYGMPLAALADSAKAGHISNADGQALLKFMNDTDARETIEGLTEDGRVVDKPNPDYGKNAMDSPLYQMSANGGVARTSVVDARYSLGFGVNSLARKAEAFASTANSIINLGGLDACDKVQSWWGRSAGIIGGVILGGFTLGGSVGVSAAIQAGMIVFSYFIDDIMASVLTKTLITEYMASDPVARGSAVWTGMAAIHSQHSLSRGMMPGTAEQIVAYQMEQNEARQTYIALEKKASNPLDMNNPYSVAGSVSLAVANHLPDSLSSSTMASLPANLSSFVLSGLGSVLSPYSAQAAALDPTRYKQCDDASYKDIGIDADVQCNVRYVMPESSMRLDPLEVAQWMEDQGYVEPDTTTGMPKGYSPPADSENQNLAMAFIMGQIDSIYNTRSYGETDQGKEYGKFLDFCVYRTMPFGESYEENGSFGDAAPEWKSGKNCMRTEPTEPEDEESKRFGRMIDYFRMYTFDISVNDDLNEAPIISEVNCGPSGSSSGASGPKMSEVQFKELLTEYGLPEPQEETSTTLTMYTDPVLGYKQLSEQLKDPKAAWATQALLNGERKWKAAGEPIKEYMNTTWIWFENGQDKWPDPYQMNCQDVEGGTNAARVCPTSASGGYQVAGFQAGDRMSSFREVYDKLYEENDLPSILKAVVDNSTNASREQWDYHDPSNNSMKVYFEGDFSGTTLNDLWPSKPFHDTKAHIQSVILAKDPNMTAALNSFAVSDSDVLAHIGTGTGCGPGWGHYICEGHRQAMANMMYALYLFDGSGPSGGASCSGDGPRATGEGLGSIVEGNPDPENNFMAQWGNGLYKYGIQYGLDGTGHTGIDIGGERGANVFTPVSGTVRCKETDNVECFAFNSYKQDVGSPDTCTIFSPMPEYRDGAGLIELTLDNGHVLIFGHMLDSVVQVGQKVEAGQKIGTVGCMNGHHTHLEYRIPSQSTESGWLIVDPEQYLGR